MALLQQRVQQRRGNESLLEELLGNRANQPVDAGNLFSI
jgi:hypothetical protein